MLNRQLPPLNAIRFFEVAALHSSFKTAAVELCVTSGAVSRQIALLEEDLGCLLFERRHREVVLTKDGQNYLASVHNALDRLRESTRMARLGHRSRPIHIWCPLTFGMRWLAPRLKAFRLLHPSREVTITTLLGPVDALLHQTDIAIRIGQGRWPGLTCHRLVGIDLIPVCSPHLLTELGRPMTLEDLSKQTFLQSAARPGYWKLWLDAVGAVDVDPTHGMTVESISLAYQLAADGAGIALGQHALIAADLASGRLVTPFAHTESIKDAFYLIYPPAKRVETHVRAFADWIIGEVEAAEALRRTRLESLVELLESEPNRGRAMPQN